MDTITETKPANSGRSPDVRSTDWLSVSFEERAERLLSKVYRGIHHCGTIKKEPGQWSTNHYGQISTYDFDELTRLVIAAHEFCVRVSIQSSGPRMVKIVLHPRKTREGDVFDRHPTIEDAITRYNG